MTNEEKARKIVEHYETMYNDTRDLLWYDLEEIAVQAMQWKDEQFAVLLRTELATWQGNSAEAKYRREMLKELLNQFK